MLRSVERGLLKGFHLDVEKAEFSSLDREGGFLKNALTHQ